MKRGGVAQRLGGHKNKKKVSASDEYTTKFPSLDGKKTTESSTTVVTATEKSSVTEDLSNHNDQRPKTIPQEKKTVTPASKTNPARNYFTRTPVKNVTSSGNHSHHQDQKNGVPQSTFHNKNFFNRPTTDSPVAKEKIPAQVNRDNPPTVVNPNLFVRKPQQSGGNNSQNNLKQQQFNSQVHNQNNLSSAPRSRNFHQQNNNQQYNRDRYFAKGSGPPASSNLNYDQQLKNSVGPTSAGTGRTLHSGGNYNQYNNHQCKYLNLICVTVNVRNW